LLPLELLMWLLFQSTPGINTGRIQTARLAFAGTGSFNPRPALIPGESEGGHFKTPDGRVSIHARH